MKFQYVARWLNGDTTHEMLHPDVHLVDVDFTSELGVGRLTATLPPEYLQMRNHSGRDVFREWATTIDVYIENDLVDSYLLTDITDKDSIVQIDCVSWLGYWSGMPWTGTQYVGRDVPFNSVATALVLNVARWPGARLGVGLEFAESSWPRLGNPIPTDLPKIPPTPKAPPEFKEKRPASPTYPKRPPAPTRPAKGKMTDAQYKSALAKYNSAHDAWEKAWNNAKANYESAKKKHASDVTAYEARKKKSDEAWSKYRELVREWEAAVKEEKRVRDDAMVKFNWWTTHDLLTTLQGLCDENDTYMVLRHENENSRKLVFFRDSVRRRSDISFVDGENVMKRPDIHRGGQKQGRTFRVLGAGEGDKMRESTWFYDAGGANGLNRVSTLVDKRLYTDKMVSDKANAMVRKRYSVYDSMELLLIDSSFAPFRQFEVGDEVRYQTLDRRGLEFDQWVLITEISCKPDKGEWVIRVSPMTNLE